MADPVRISWKFVVKEIVISVIWNYWEEMWGKFAVRRVVMVGFLEITLEQIYIVSFERVWLVAIVVTVVISGDYCCVWIVEFIKESVVYNRAFFSYIEVIVYWDPFGKLENWINPLRSGVEMELSAAIRGLTLCNRHSDATWLNTATRVATDCRRQWLFYQQRSFDSSNCYSRVA